jgi:hypothetical protein
MKAKEAPVGEWIMLKRTKQWFKKQKDGKHQIECTQIGSKQKFYVDNDEEVEVRR